MKKYKKSKKQLQKQGGHEKEEKPKKRLSATFWMGSFIAAIMILSVIGFVWKGGEVSELEYNGFSFTLTEDRLWAMDYNGKLIRFYNHPSELEYLEVGPAASSALKGTKMVYVTSDPEDPLKEGIGWAEFEIMDALESKGTYFVYSFTEENEFNKTVVTCSNATQAVPVIYFRQGNTTSITYDQGCITAESDSMYGIQRIRDRIIYSSLGVME